MKRGLVYRLTTGLFTIQSRNSAQGAVASGLTHQMILELWVMLQNKSATPSRAVGEAWPTQLCRRSEAPRNGAGARDVTGHQAQRHPRCKMVECRCRPGLSPTAERIDKSAVALFAFVRGTHTRRARPRSSRKP